MKTIFHTAILILSTTLLACTSNKESSEIIPSKEEAIQEVVQNIQQTDEEKPEEKSQETADNNNQSIQSRYNYAEDWKSIKRAIDENNENELSAWICNPDLKASNVLMIFQLDKEVLEALMKTTYEDLTVSELEDGDLLEFSFEQSGTDEEGVEYESGVYLYLKQDDPNLMVYNILAAG